jgi:hypothetical protein
MKMRKNKILAIEVGIIITLLVSTTGCFDDNNNKSNYVSWGKLMNDYEDNGFKSYEPEDKIEIIDDILDTSGDEDGLYIDFKSTSYSENTLDKYDILVIELSEEEMENIDSGRIKFYLTIETRKDFDDKTYEWFKEAGKVGNWVYTFNVNIKKG